MRDTRAQKEGTFIALKGTGLSPLGAVGLQACADCMAIPDPLADIPELVVPPREREGEGPWTWCPHHPLSP